MKKAVLVTVEVTTRVVVDTDDNDEKIMEKAIPQLVRSLTQNGVCDHITTDSIVDDVECPFGSLLDDK